MVLRLRAHDCTMLEEVLGRLEESSARVQAAPAPQAPNTREQHKGSIGLELAAAVSQRLQLLTGVSGAAEAGKATCITRWRFAQLGMRVLGGLHLEARKRAGQSEERSAGATESTTASETGTKGGLTNTAR